MAKRVNGMQHDQDAAISAFLARYLADESAAVDRLLDAVQNDTPVIDAMLATERQVIETLLAGLHGSDQDTRGAPMGDLTTP